MHQPKLSYSYLMQALCLTTLLVVCTQVQASTSRQVTPPLQWKYGWNDGGRANTVGWSRHGDPLPLASSTLNSGYTPAQISHAYGFDQISSAGDGRGQTIALVVAYGSPTLQQDFNVFCTQYGLPSATLSIVYPSGRPSVTDSGWAGETSLDVEWAHAMAPGANLIVVVAPDNGMNSLLVAVNYAANTLHASVVSMSWGMSEFYGDSAYDSIFNNPATSFVAASGDNGAGVDWPACSPYVLGVGGTTLQYNASSGSVTSEVAWSGSGGGVSRTETLPAYQSSFNVNAGRGVPDVSYVADPYTGLAVYVNGGWQVFGGTSAGTPQWAALLARRASLGNASSISFNTLLYSNAKNSYATFLRDITSGNNGYYAVNGYDLVTGLGSPVANNVALIPQVLPTPSPSPTATPKPSPTPTPAPTASPRPSATPTPSPTPKSRPSPTPSPTPIKRDDGRWYSLSWNPWSWW